MSIIVLLTWICIINFYVGRSNGNLCPPKMTFHKHTRTCMILEKLGRHYLEAESICKTNYIDGHLVYILDKETDDFIKSSLLDGDEFGYIGLIHIGNGHYKWGTEIIATYFGWSSLSHTPNNYARYAYIDKQGWGATTSQRYTFICQSSTIIKEILVLNNSNLVNETLETDSNTKNLISCMTTRRRNYQIQLLFHNDAGGIDTLINNDGREVNYQLQTTCSSSGKYDCIITDTSRVVVALSGTLKVRCSSSYCSAVPKFVVSTQGTQDITNKVCVRVYPNPTEFRIFKFLSQSSIQHQLIPNSRYEINLQYINDESTKGELEIKLKNVTHLDIGRYFVRVLNSYSSNRLFFNITGQPRCPGSITSQPLSRDTVTLTWSPIYDNDAKQTFIVMKEGGSDDVQLESITYQQQQQQVTYNLTGLSPSTNYTVYINVVNEDGETNCKHRKISIATQADDQTKSETRFEDDKTAVIIPLVILIAIIIIVVIVAVTVRRRRSRSSSSKKSQDHKRLTELSTDTSQYYELELDNTKYNTSKISDAPSQEVAENVYNNVLENKVNKIVRIAKPPRKSTSSSVKFKEKICMETGQTMTLENSIDTTQVDGVNISDNKEDTGENHVYANTHTVCSTPDEVDGQPDVLDTQKPPTEKENGRTINPQGLVYVSVEIRPDSKTPQLLVNEKEKITEHKTNYEPVEYSTLDYLATSETATMENNSEENVKEEQ